MIDDEFILFPHSIMPVGKAGYVKMFYNHWFEWALGPGDTHIGPRHGHEGPDVRFLVFPKETSRYGPDADENWKKAFPEPPPVPSLPGTDGVEGVERVERVKEVESTTTKPKTTPKTFSIKCADCPITFIAKSPSAKRCKKCARKHKANYMSLWLKKREERGRLFENFRFVKKRVEERNQRESEIEEHHALSCRNYLLSEINPMQQTRMSGILEGNIPIAKPFTKIFTTCGWRCRLMFITDQMSTSISEMEDIEIDRWIAEGGFEIGGHKIHFDSVSDTELTLVWQVLRQKISPFV